MNIEELKNLAFLTCCNIKISHNGFIIKSLKNDLKSLNDKSQSYNIIEKLIHHLMINKTLKEMINQ